MFERCALNFKINNQHAGQITNENASYGHTALQNNTTGVYNNLVNQLCQQIQQDLETMLLVETR
jgi:hypothetical protein